jgi:protein-L-isoaspartate O-methyltransferase
VTRHTLPLARARARNRSASTRRFSNVSLALRMRAMATPWDRAAAGYLEEWVPRFVPYHLDVVRELAVRPGQRVLVTSAGPGAEVLAVAREVGKEGFVRATDKSDEMVRFLRDSVRAAGFDGYVSCETADAADASGGPWDAILCAFGLWQLEDRSAVLRAWGDAIAPQGKVGVITWGPAVEDGPFERLRRCLQEIEPDQHTPDTHVVADRESMAKMFEESGLEMVRHTVVTHTLSFRSAETFVRAMTEACTWRRTLEDLGEERMHRIAARFYETTGGPDAPLTFQPPATIAIAAHPGAEVELAHRPSLRPPMSQPPRG